MATKTRLLLTLVLTLMAAIWVSQISLLRLDLTEERRYTLSEGTKSILAKLKAPVILRLYFSDEATREMPFLRTYFQRVREFLERYERESRGKVRLEVVDPEPFSKQEEEAISLGLKPVQLAPDAPEVIFGIAALRGEKKAVIPFLSREREPFLEYDIAELIVEVSRDRPPTLALYADPDLLVRGGIDPFTKQFQPPWVAVENLARFYEVKALPRDFGDVGQVDLLVLIHPQALSEKSLRAIDRYLMEGGRALIFVDPYAERDGPPRFVDPERAKDSNLNRLFRAYGFEQIEGKFVADDRYAVRVQIGQGKPVRHLAFLGLEGEALGEHPAVARLEKLFASSIGAFKKLDPKLNWEVLFFSSQQSMLMPTVALDYLFNPLILRDAFKPGGKRLPLAVFVWGRFSSAFERSRDLQRSSRSRDLQRSSKRRASREARLIVVADTDLLHNNLWTNLRRNPDGTTTFLPFADNGSFLINAVDFLVGDPDLIAIRGKRKLLRPFTVVEAMRQKAQRQLESKLTELRRLLQETEHKLVELQTKQRKGEALTKEDQAKLRELEKRQRKLRRELRQLRHRLEEEIERLGQRLKILNIVVAPLLLTVLLVAFAQLWLRRRAL